MTPRCAIILLLACALLACTSKPAETAGPSSVTQYQVRGVVVAVDSARRELRLQHEDIPGYMHAMTMSFPVRDEAALRGLAAGDAVTAKLNVAGPGEYWLSDIRRTSNPNPQQ
jgi:protein SCO1/2